MIGSLLLLALTGLVAGMAYSTRSHVAPGDLGTAADDNQGMDNEEALKSAFQTRQVTLIFDGSGAAPAVNTKIGFAWKGPTWTITEWNVAEVGAVSGSCAFDVWRDASAVPTTSAKSIVGGGGNKPTVTTSTRAAAAPSGWTSVTINTNDEIVLNLDSVTTMQKIAVTLKGTVAV